MFLSFSQVDTTRAREIVRVLEQSGHAVWTFLNDVPAGVIWRRNMLDAVVGSDVVLFLCSEDSIRSGPCVEEIQCAQEHGKKVVVVQASLAVNPSDLPESIGHLKEVQWVWSTDDDAVLVDAVDTDFDLVQELTLLDIRATEWANGRNAGRLLRGAPLIRAQELVASPSSAYTPKSARPSDRARDYVQASTVRRTRNRRLTAALSMAIVAVLIVAAGVAVNRYTAEQDARRRGAIEQLVAEAGRLASNDPALSLRLLRAAYSLTPDATQHARVARGILATRLNGLQPEPGSRTRALAYSRDGSQVVTGGFDGLLRVYPSIGSPTQQRLSSIIYDVATARGTDLTAASTPDAIDVMRIAEDGSITMRATTPAVGFETGTVDMSADGALLVSGGLTPFVSVLAIGQDGKLRLLPPLPASRGVVTTFTFADEGHRLAVADEGAVTVWDLSTPDKPVREASIALAFPGSAAVAFGPGGRELAVSDKGRATLYDVSGAEPRTLLTTPQGAVDGDVAVLPASRPGLLPELATITPDNGIALWASTTTSPQVVLRQDRTDPVRLAVSPDGGRIAVGGEDGSLTEWLVRERGIPGPLATGSASDDLTDLAPSPAQGLLGYTTANARAATIVRVPDGRRSETDDFSGLSLSLDIDDTGTIAFGKSTGFLVAGSTPSLTDPRAGEQPALYPVSGVHFGADGTLIGTEDGEGPGFVWRLTPQALVMLGQLDDGPIAAVAFNPAGDRIAAASRDGTTRIYDIGPTGITLSALIPSDDDRPAMTLAWRGDGRTLAVGTERGIRVADTTTPQTPVIGQTDDRESTTGLDLVAAPDRPLLMNTGSGRLNLWDTTDPGMLLPVASRDVGPSTAPTAARFSKDGRWLAVSDLRNWQLLDLGELVDIASDPLPALCAATEATSLPTDIAEMVAALDPADLCQR